jgi:hypothetical protein
VRWLLVVALLLAGACSGDDEPDRSSVLPDVVPGVAGDYDAVVVRSGGTVVEAPRPVWDEVIPMLMARRLRAPEPLASYGLDDPAARVRFARPGADIVIDLGGPNFDRTGRYVRPAAGRQISLVLNEQLDPLLDLVGQTDAR